jgi:hypothetical protein
MTLALAQHAAATFNGLFYATCATVIPVLFLAIAVQGTVYDELLKASARLAARARARGRFPYAASLTLSICGLVVIYGAVGEIFALTALAHQQNGFAQEWIAAPAAIGLTIIAAAGPARIFINAVISAATRDHTVTWTGKPKARDVPDKAERQQQETPSSADPAE